ncbi:hypothetical protein B0H13DRAFT_2305409 [Mycena leptocephala]|nr:hypothetical protein B0H13DRAFT_2305409 [Mycena leptocephala]
MQSFILRAISKFYPFTSDGSAGHYLKSPNFGLANSQIFWRSYQHLGMELGAQVFDTETTVIDLIGVGGHSLSVTQVRGAARKPKSQAPSIPVTLAGLLGTKDLAAPSARRTERSNRALRRWFLCASPGFFFGVSVRLGILFARDFHDEIRAIAAQRAAYTGINAAAAHQIVLKEMWDALSAEEKSDWDSQAEDEAADVESNQKEFSTNIHLALRSLCQGGLLVFTDTKHNKTHFGGDDLAQTYGIAWSKFAESAIPRPAVSTLASVTVDEDGTVNFPLVDLDNTPVAHIQVLLEDYLEKCWSK